MCNFFEVVIEGGLVKKVIIFVLITDNVDNKEFVGVQKKNREAREETKILEICKHDGLCWSLKH